MFLLSDTEVYAYFSSEAATVTDYTAYALSEDPWAGNATAPAPAIWWLRTTDGGNHPDSVYTRGGVGEGARSYEGEYVRPATWVDMSQTTSQKNNVAKKQVSDKETAFSFSPLTNETIYCSL